MKKSILPIIVLGLACLLGGTAFGGTLNVPSQYSTIQAAIDAAVNGDDVLVDDGTYVEKINLLGKAITVHSKNGPELTIIDGGGSGSVVNFTSGEESDSVVQGFTITNGVYNYYTGGGIRCRNSNPTISNCIISGNSNQNGGGIYCQQGNPTITNCTISDNSAQYGGGGISCGSSSPTITDCIIRMNSAAAGGGIGGYACTPVINNCIISNNAAQAGGGMRFWQSTSQPTITNCIIVGNTAESYGGGGLDFDESIATVANCTIAGNSADGSGGGIRCDAATVTVVNTILWGNSPQEIYGSAITVTYCDINGGYPGDGNIDCDPQWIGGGDYHLAATSCCVDAGTADGAPSEDMEGDTRPQGSGYDIGADEHVGPRGFIVLDREGYRLGADVNILVMDSDLNINPTAAEQYSDIIAIVTTGGDEESGITMMETGPDTGMFLGSITIAQAPVTTEDGILQIECGMSDVITATYYETGNPEPPTDTADTDCYPPEITGTQVTDIGDIKSTMTWDTDEPADSCVQYGTSVPPLLSACDTSLVTDHTINLTGLSPDTTYYFATVSTDRAGNQTVDDNNGQYYQFTTLAQGTHYVPDDFVTIQEGLNLLSSTSQNEIVVRPGTYAETVNFMGKEITVRSESGPEVTLIDGGYADEVVIFDAGEGPDAVLDGFTISNGAYCGISCEADTSPTITNCIITGNSDGGMYSSDASPTISNCTITSNAGGGMRCWGGSPTIIHCTIAYNMNPDFLGGAMFLFSGCSPEISHCTLSNNTAAAGGAIWCQDSSPTITNCTITDNSAQEGGGGIDVGWSNLTIDKCTLSGNSGDDGGAISIRWDSTASISNCVISGNTASDGGAVHCEDSNPTVANCTINGNAVSGEGGAISSYDYYEVGNGPTVLNTILWGDTAGGGSNEIYVDFGASINVTYSDIQGGWPGTDNIDCNPDFVGSGDYHLLPSSCCIDAGTSNGAPNEDMDGEVRPHGDDYDIGADEYYPVHAGFILLDRQVYAPGVDVNILVSDSDLNTNSGDIEQYSNIIRITTAEGDIESSVAMTETGPDTGVFTGAIAVADGVAISEDDVLEIDCQATDTITATYYDADDGTGQPATPSDTADTDCDRPGVTGVQVADTGYTTAAITWNTDESADGCVFYGTSAPQLSECQSSLVTAHTIHLTGLLPDTTYYFSVASTDEAGNQTIDDNGGQYYQLHTSVLATQWAMTYGGSGSDSARCIQEIVDEWGDPDGYIVAGSTYFGAGKSDVWILKLDLDGSVAWQKTYGGSHYDGVSSIQQTFNQIGQPDGYIVAGSYGYSVDASYNDLWVLKLNPDGTVVWEMTYGGSGGEGAVSVQQTFNALGQPDGYIVAGNTNSFGEGNRDVWVLKLNTNGSIAWQKTYGGSEYEYASSIQKVFNQQGEPDGYVVAGHTRSFGADEWGDMWILRLDSSGSVVWEKRYGGSIDEDYANTVHQIFNQQGEPDGYIVEGTTWSFGSGWEDAWVLRLGSAGDVLWQKTYGGDDWDWTHSIKRTLDDGYMVVGCTTSFGGSNQDLWLLKLNANGTVAWQKTACCSSSALSVQQTLDGGYAVAGWTYSFGAGNNDLWVLKLDGDGEMPNCNIMDTSSPVVTDTSVSGLDTSASVYDSSASLSSTGVTPQNTWAETWDTCSASVADFTADNTNGTAPLTVQFTDQSTGAITEYYWDFGDSETSSEQNPSHEYQSAGDYTVSLTVTGPGGSDTETKTDYITVTEPVINITELVPTHGGYGTTIKVKGTGFGEQRSVMIDAQDGYYSFITFSGQSETMMATKYLLWSDTLVKVIFKKLFIDQDGDYLQDGNEPLLTIGDIPLDDYAVKVNTIWFHDLNSNGIYDKEDEIYSSASSNSQTFTLTDEPMISKRLPAEIPRLDVLKIWGYNFGAEQGDGVVRIGLGSQAASDTLGLGTVLDGYLKWTDTVIKVKMRVSWAYNNKTRWIWVETGGKKSNAKPVKILPYVQ